VDLLGLRPRAAAVNRFFLGRNPAFRDIFLGKTGSVGGGSFGQGGHGEWFTSWVLADRLEMGKIL